MREDLINRLIEHSESSDSPLLKLIIEDMKQSKRPPQGEQDRQRDNDLSEAKMVGTLSQAA